MEEVLPNALMIGVEYDLFWTLNPKSLTPFIKAFRLKQEYEDSMNWMLGSYIQSAIASAFNKSSKYPAKPFMKLAEETSNQALIKARFMAKMEQLNARFRKEE